MLLRNLALAAIFVFVGVDSASALCRKGDDVTALWKDNKWYEGKVRKVKDNGKKCFISYNGYDKSYNEWVGGNRYLLSSRKVSVLWKDNKWYNAKVLDRRQNAYLVHYQGYNKSYDEWVDNNRISTGRK